MPSKVVIKQDYIFRYFILKVMCCRGSGLALETGVSKWGVLTACLKEDKDKFRGCVCNNLFQETVQCSKALHGHFIMDFQELTAVEYLGRVAASKGSLIITDHLENNLAMRCPLD